MYKSNLFFKTTPIFCGPFIVEGRFKLYALQDFPFIGLHSALPRQKSDGDTSN